MPSLSKLLLVPLVGLAAAHKKYVALNPNGNNTGIPAIGHVDPQGGGAANQYGKDFSAAGNKWTVELCQMDSDGDGQTNGFELGDPCCVWKEGQPPLFTRGISQPGNATSKSLRPPYTNCSHALPSEPAPAPGSHQMLRAAPTQ